MPALKVASSVLLVTITVGAAMLGEHALTFQELGELLVGDPEFRLGLFTFWTLAMAPAARTGLLAPGLSYLRSLPHPGWLPRLHLLGLLLLLHGVLGIPVLAAGFPAQGIGIGLAGVAIGGALLPGSGRWPERSLRFAAVVGLVALVQQGLWLPAAAASGPVIAWRILAAWKHSASWGTGRRTRTWVFGGRLASIVSSQALYLWRREAMLVYRIAVVGALGVLLIRSMRLANAGQVSLTMFHVASTPALAIISLMLALGLKRARRDADWLSRSLGIYLRSERAASLLLEVVVGAVLQVTCALAAGFGVAATALALPYALAWAALGLRLGSRSHEDVRAVSWGFALALVAMTVIGLTAPWMFAVLVSLAMLAATPMFLRETPDA